MKSKKPTLKKLNLFIGLVTGIVFTLIIVFAYFKFYYYKLTPPTNDPFDFCDPNSSDKGCLSGEACCSFRVKFRPGYEQGCLSPTVCNQVRGEILKQY